MSSVRVESVEEPFIGKPRSSTAAAQLLFRAEYLGLLSEELLQGPLSGSRIEVLLQTLTSQGVAASAVLRMRHILEPSDEAPAISDDTLASLIGTVSEQVAQSPLPDREWAPLRSALGDDLLARLLDVSASSLRRYADGARDTPDDVAARLHIAAMITADLAGGYNERGMRRWFARPRAQLNGKSPLDVLQGGFDPDSDSTARVCELAAWLSGAGSAT